MNATANNAIDADKRKDTVAHKKLNVVADKVINIDKRQDATAGKQLNITVEPLMLIKDQIIRRIKLRGWIRVG